MTFINNILNFMHFITSSVKIYKINMLYEVQDVAWHANKTKCDNL